MSGLRALLGVCLASLIYSRTYKKRFYVDNLSKRSPGKIIDVQSRAFKLGKNGTINITISCSQEIYQPSNQPFNVFMCTENPKANWLYLYPDWGMCFFSESSYHHCSIHPMKHRHPATYELNLTSQKEVYVVIRLRSCPSFRYNLKSNRSRGQMLSELSPLDFETYQNIQQRLALSENCFCNYVGIFKNSNSPLSLDEVWNPITYKVFLALYSFLLLKALYEMIRYTKKFRVNCAFYVYVLIAFKFLYILMMVLYYRMLTHTSHAGEYYTNYEFGLIFLLSAKFTSYYVMLLVIAHGYCVYNTRMVLTDRFVVTFGGCIFCGFLYMFILNDSYVEVAVVVISGAGYAAVLSLIWAVHFKRLVIVRHRFFRLMNCQQHSITLEQIRWKERLIVIAFLEIIALLVNVIVYEFYSSEYYPCPSSSGAVAVETLDLVLIVPLSLSYNLRDLSKYYPIEEEQSIFLIRGPCGDIKISYSDDADKDKKSNTAPLARSRRSSDSLGSVMDPLHNIRLSLSNI